MANHASQGKHDVTEQQTPPADVRARRVTRRTDVDTPEPIEIDLVAAVLAMLDDEPVALLGSLATRGGDGSPTLPFAVFTPSSEPSLDGAARQCLFRAGNLDPGHVEQLSSYSCEQRAGENERRSLAIGYLALVRAEQLPHLQRSSWLRIYDLLPWEDWRQGRPGCLRDLIEPALLGHEGPRGDGGAASASQAARVRIAFGLGDSKWDDERVAERLEILEEANLLARVSPLAMDPTHRRIVAAALGRLRARLRHRPVVFEMLPKEFTLFELQRAVEAILGPHLHKQNFRRLVEGMGLVEPTGEVRNHTGGRPARLFRFRPAVMLERPAAGVRIRPGKAA